MSLDTILFQKYEAYVLYVYIWWSLYQFEIDQKKKRKEHSSVLSLYSMARAVFRFVAWTCNLNFEARRLYYAHKMQCTGTARLRFRISAKHRLRGHIHTIYESLRAATILHTRKSTWYIWCCFDHNIGWWNRLRLKLHSLLENDTIQLVH